MRAVKVAPGDATPAGILNEMVLLVASHGLTPVFRLTKFVILLVKEVEPELRLKLPIDREEVMPSPVIEIPEIVIGLVKSQVPVREN